MLIKFMLRWPNIFTRGIVSISHYTFVMPRVSHVLIDLFYYSRIFFNNNFYQIQPGKRSYMAPTLVLNSISHIQKQLCRIKYLKYHYYFNNE